MKPLLSIVLMLSPLRVMACGLDWSPPVSHFENVDYQGNVHIVRKLGEVESLPIYLIFNSSFGVSPYVGSGFEIPLLESRIWQVDENRFQARMPSGWLWMFQRTKDPSVLEGNAGWKGLVKDDTITVWAPCGDKIIFKNGRILSMKLKEDLYFHNYQNGRVASVEKNGKSFLEVKSESRTGKLTGINISGTREIIGLAVSADRPVVEPLAGGNVVSRVEKTLAEVTLASGAKETFEHVLNGEMNPTIKLDDKLIAWNPATKKITKDGEWVYSITSHEDPCANAEIRRENSKGEEFWHYDGGRGMEFIQGIDGIKQTTSWFMTGNLAGKLRKKVVAENAGEITISPSYSEQGDLVRTTTYKHFSLKQNNTIVKKTVLTITDRVGNPQSIFAQ